VTRRHVSGRETCCTIDLVSVFDPTSIRMEVSEADEEQVVIKGPASKSEARSSLWWGNTWAAIDVGLVEHAEVVCGCL
jgi:hypothetical protein